MDIKSKKNQSHPPKLGTVKLTAMIFFCFLFFRLILTLLGHFCSYRERRFLFSIILVPNWCSQLMCNFFCLSYFLFYDFAFFKNIITIQNVCLCKIKACSIEYSELAICTPAPTNILPFSLLSLKNDIHCRKLL